MRTILAKAGRILLPVMDGDASYIVHRPDHWIYEGTGLKRGDRFGAKDTIVGYECDGC